MKILDNIKTKPIKIDVKPSKGPSGKVNITIFERNKSGIATIMITKTKDAQLIHVKTLAFKVVKYLLDGIIDGEIKENDFINFKVEDAKSSGDEAKDEQLYCSRCEKLLKTKNGLKIHMKNVHGREISPKEVSKLVCDECDFSSKRESDLKRHKRDKHDRTTASTSPKPKKRKKMTTEEPMEVDNNDDSMDVDESKDVLIERSKMWDEKIRKKKLKEEEEEKERNEMKKHKENQERLKKEEEVKKLKNAKKLKAKSEQIQHKSFLKDLPIAAKKFLGDGYFLYPVKGDGSCGLRAIAA